REEQGRLTRGQQASVTDLSRAQRGLGDETSKMAARLSAAEGFSMALKRGATEMGRAADLLDQIQTGAESQHAQQRALDRLALVLEALQDDKPEKEKDMENPGGMGPPPGGQPPPPSDGLHTLSELKLLKLMQEDVRLRTA